MRLKLKRCVEIMSLKIIAWELTRRCGLDCRHCRGAASDRDYAGELTTVECIKTIDAIVRVATPMLILTGGEPLMRDDLTAVAAYATDRGCRVVLATCGHRLTPVIVSILCDCGVRAVSVSLDAVTAEAHDAFRGVAGAYAKTLDGIQCLKAAGMPFQINTTVSKLNVDTLPELLDQAIALGAAAMDFFFLVPTGRGAGMAELALEPKARDRALAWIAELEHATPLHIRTTCAPQYGRFRKPAAAGREARPFRGCMGGRGFVFISHTGRLQPCGFLELPCGDLRSAGFDFGRLYAESEGFRSMRARNPFDECAARAHAFAGIV